MDNLSTVSGLLGGKPITAPPSNFDPIWWKWYKGKDPSFHTYKIYNGEKETRMSRFSLHVAKKVCQDWASLLMNEKVEIGVTNQDLLNKVFMAVDFYNKTNKSVEYGFALAQCGISVEIDGYKIEFDEVEENGKKEIVNKTMTITENTKESLAIYHSRNIVPITIENNEITEVAFVRKDSKETVVTMHTKNEDGTYKITIAKVSNESGAVGFTFSFDVKYQVFAIVHPEIVNNIDIDSPYPISIFANAIDTMKSIDIVFDSYSNEFQLGRKRIFVSSEMDTVSKEDGKIDRFFDPNDVVIHQLPPSVSATGETKPLIHEVNGQLRTQEHSQALKDLLSVLGSQCELGSDYYNFEKGRVMTATQVISEKSDTFRNLKKHEGVFEKALHVIVRALMYVHDEFTLDTDKFNDYENIAIHFDDSIIEDKATEKENDKKDIELGAMSLVQYRMKWYAEDEETAIESVKKIYGDPELLKRLQNFSPYLTQGTITPLQFVKMVYVDIKEESKQNELAEEIRQNLKSGNEVFSEAELMSLRGAQ